MNFSIGFRTAPTVSFAFLFFKRISFIIFASRNWLVIVGSDIV
jgi:hypothetical protein